MYKNLSFDMHGISTNIFFVSQLENIPTKAHNHSYCEVHFLCGGKMGFESGGRVYDLGEGSVLAFPANTLHSCIFAEKSSHCAILIDRHIDSVLSFSRPEFVNKSFADIYREAIKSDNYTAFAEYISFLCADIFPVELASKPAADAGLVISEYISLNYYKSPSLSELAALLHLSEKHTERMVKKYTGMTFGRCLTHHRMRIARELISEGRLTLGQIAEYVGFKSYSGFWKALNNPDSE